MLPWFITLRRNKEKTVTEMKNKECKSGVVTTEGTFTQSTNLFGNEDS